MAIVFPDDTLFFDIETHSIDEKHRLPPREYFRIGGWTWGESDEVWITTDYDEMIRVIRSARVVSGHNIHMFDLSVLFGVDSVEPVEMSRLVGVFDSMTHATLSMSPPDGTFVDRKGTTNPCWKPEHYLKWYRLDNLAFQLGVPGKIEDVLGRLAKEAEYELVPQFSVKTGKQLKNPKKVKLDICCGYGHIRLDHPEYVEYLKQDVRAQREVSRALLARTPFDRYAQREQLKWAIYAQISRNGFRVDQDLATSRVRDMAEEAAYALDRLHRLYGLPLSGKKPLSTDAGKAALLLALKSVGVEESDLARTDKNNTSFSGDSIRTACGMIQDDEGNWFAAPDANPEAVEMAELVAMLAGQRSLPELTLASVQPDGYVHPDIRPLQRSGRQSTTNPGMTVFDPKHKDYFVADSPDHSLIEFDLANADQRAVGAMSGDRKYLLRFEPGQDGHLINAWAAWGKDVVGTDKRDPVTAKYRFRAKAPGHGWSYRIGAKKCAKTTGLTLQEAKDFLGALNREYRDVVRWQDNASRIAGRQGWIENDWGRRMPVVSSRAFTQGPALLGQSTTNEILADGLIKLPMRCLRMIKLTIHDAIVASIPNATLERDRDLIAKCLTTRWKPRYGGVEIEFPVTYGSPAPNWKEAGH